MEGQRQLSINVRQSSGKFTRQALPGDNPDFVQSVQRSDGTHYDVYSFATLEGFLVSIGTTTEQYSDKQVRVLIINIADNIVAEKAKERRALRLNLKSRSASDILKRLDNIDLTLPVTIHSGADPSGDKIRSFIWISQMGQKVPLFYTAKEPKDLPRWREVRIDDELKYDRTDELKFWDAKLSAYALKIHGIQDKALMSAPDYTPRKAFPPVSDFFKVDDDLPF